NRRRDGRSRVDRTARDAVLRAQVRHRSRSRDGSHRTGNDHSGQHDHWRSHRLYHDRTSQLYGARDMTQTLCLHWSARRISRKNLRQHMNRIYGAAAGGYTLIEMLVVLTIIGLIMGLIGPRVLSYLSDARVKTARLQIESLSSSLDLFYLDAGRYPTSSEGL